MGTPKGFKMGGKKGNSMDFLNTLMYLILISNILRQFYKLNFSFINSSVNPWNRYQQLCIHVCPYRELCALCIFCSLSMIKDVFISWWAIYTGNKMYSAAKLRIKHLNVFWFLLLSTFTEYNKFPSLWLTQLK